MEDVTSFAQAAESHLDDVYAYLVWFTGDRFARRGSRRRDVRAGAPALAPVRPEARLGPHLALPGRADDRARPLPLREAPPRGASRSRPCPSGSRSGCSKGLSPELEAALARLSAGEREVIALRVVLDFDARTAAGMLGISPTNCTTRLNRALGKLEEALGVAA